MGMGALEDMDNGEHAGPVSSFIDHITQISLRTSPWTLSVNYVATCTEAPMHGHGPGQRARLTPSKKWDLCYKKGAGRGVYLAA